MKKLKLCLLTILCLLIPNLVKAANANINITGASQVVIGNKVTVTVTLSSNTAIGSWEMQLNYDKNYLQLLSSSADNNGTFMLGVTDSINGIKKTTYTFTFKTLKTGTTSISMGSYYIVAYDESTMNVSVSNKNLKIITQQELEDSYSKDNYLKSLSIEGFELDQAFNKETMNYSVNVPEGTTEIKINAVVNDNRSSITGDGTVSVSEGINTINVVVRAQNGSERTYVILVNVIDENPINVTIMNNNYTVIKLRSSFMCPNMYEEKDIEINGFQIPACFNEKINYTLVGLKKEDGTIESFVYNNGNYQKYLETTGTSLKIIILDYQNDLMGYQKYLEKIDGVEYDVFKASAKSTNYIVYGLNIETGKKDFYNYDSLNKTFSLYDNEQIDGLIRLTKTYLYVIIAFGIGLFLSLICMFTLSKKKKVKAPQEESKEEKEELKEILVEDNNKMSKKQKKKKKQEEQEAIKESIIKEEVNELKEKINEEPTKEFYDIFEDDKKSKKKDKEKN